MGIETSGVNAAVPPVPVKSGTSSARADTKDDAATGGFSALLSAADAPAPSAQDAAAQANPKADASAESETEDGSDATAAAPAQATPDSPLVDNSAMIAALLAAVQGSRPTDAAEVKTPLDASAEGKTEALTALLNGKTGAAAGTALASGLSGADAKAATEHLKTALGDYGSVLEQLRARGEKTGAGAAAAANSLNTAAAQQSVVGKNALQAQVDLAARSDRLGNALAQAANNSQSLATAAMVATQLESVEHIASAQTRVGGVDGGSLGGLVPDRPFAHGGFTPTVQYDAAAGAALANPATSSADVADQVSYWVAQGVQNAEMTVEGANAERVHVSISLSGNEAHVSFRADQAVTRDMLSSSEAHLKELLGSQGLVLSGLSVANSGAGGAGQADGSGGQRQQARSQEGFAGQGESAGEHAAAPTRAPAGELDLYV